MLMTKNPPSAAATESGVGHGGEVGLFSYGTLQDRGVQLANFGRELDGRPDALPGYRLEVLTITAPDVVTVSGSADHPIAVKTDDPEDDIRGTVFTLTAAELSAADRYEVEDYTRVEVLLRSGTRAWAYVNSPAPIARSR
jgi:hypothetical protein